MILQSMFPVLMADIDVPSVQEEGQVKDPQSYETMALSCSLMPRSLALMGHAIDLGDAALILNQRIADKLASMPGRVEYKLHFIIPPDLAFTLRTASSSLYRYSSLNMMTPC